MIEVQGLTKRYGGVGRAGGSGGFGGFGGAEGPERSGESGQSRGHGSGGSHQRRGHQSGGRTVVDGLCFRVRPGRVTGFLGPNGAGKSTTLRMILGLETPTAGTATIGGVAFRSRRRGLRHVGALLDAGDVHGGRMAVAHLRALARGNAIGRARVDDVLAEVGLSEVARRRVGAFSLGMRQRLGIAAALLGDPPVLVFDEPVNGLDPEGVRWLRGLFRRLAAEGRTVFVSSHLMSEMENTADDLVVIGRGRLLAAEPVAVFAARASSRRGVSVRTPSPDALAAVLRDKGARVVAGGEGSAGDRADGIGEGLLTVAGMDADRVGELAHRHRIRLRELTARTGSLEEAFMELTSDTGEYVAGGKQ